MKNTGKSCCPVWYRGKQQWVAVVNRGVLRRVGVVAKAFVMFGCGGLRKR